MMQSSNGPLEAMRALGSISSGSGGGSGMVPAAMHLAQRGALGDAYPAALMQQQYLQSLPWLLRMQVGRAHVHLDALALVLNLGIPVRGHWSIT